MFFLINFGILFIFAKSVGDNFPFYKTAIFYSLAITVLNLLISVAFAGKVNAVGLVVFFIIKLVLSLPYFYLLDRLEDSIFAWLLVFAVGGILIGAF